MRCRRLFEGFNLLACNRSVGGLLCDSRTSQCQRSVLIVIARDRRRVSSLIRLSRSFVRRINSTVQINTNEYRGFLFHAQAQLVRPTMVKKTRLSFSLTQIGNTSVRTICLSAKAVVMSLAKHTSLFFCCCFRFTI